MIAKGSAADRVRRAQDAVDAAAPGVDDTKDVCSSPPKYGIGAAEACTQLSDATGSYNTARHISTIGFVGASVGAAATLLTLVLWPSAPVNPEVQASAGAASFGLSGRF